MTGRNDAGPMTGSDDAGRAAASSSGMRPGARSALIIGLVTLALFSVARVVLLGVYWPIFSDLSTIQLARGLVHGVRFDLSIAILVMGLPLMLLLIPARWAQRETWQRPIRWLAYGLVVILLFVMAADLVYFSVARRHLGSELALTLSSDWQAAARMPLEFPLPLAAFVAVAVVLALLWRRLPRGEAGERRYGWKQWVAWAALLPLAVLGVRGGFQWKPLNMVNAFEYGAVAEGYLTLNGPFSAFHSARNTQRNVTVRAYPWEEAVRRTRSRFALDRSEWVSDAYPLERHFLEGAALWRGAPAAATAPPNVVILVLESWDALLTDSIRARDGLEPLGITPNFDALVPRGRLFTRFLSSGQLSIEGLGALLASIPTVPGMPYMGTGLEQSRLAFIGDLAGAHGYEGVFVRSAKRGSFRLDAVASLAGFGTYAGAEDILQEPSHTEVEPGYWGAWDYDSFRYFHKRLLEAEEPFIGVFFGSSTHQPFPSPGDQWTLRTPDTREDRFLNAVHYVDWALGRYMEMAREAGYAENTLFVILADQTSAFVPGQTLPDRHRIPALLLGPGIATAVDDRVASQMDILPTVVDYLGWTSNHASFGESLLGERRPAALLKNGDTMVRVGPDGWVLHDLRRRIDGGGSEAVQDSLEAALLAEVQVVTRLVVRNHVFSGAGTASDAEPGTPAAR